MTAIWAEYAARDFETVRPPAWREIARPEQLPPAGEWLVWAYVAGRGCIAGSTRIYLPLEGRHERADVLTAAGKPVTVLALTDDGPRPIMTDGAPFIKGVAPLYEVTTDDGHTVMVTAQHRFLGPQGWLRLADVRVGQPLAAGAPAPQRGASSCRPASPEDAPRSMETGEGSPGRCPKCHHCDDPRPRLGVASGQASPPSPGDACGRSPSPPEGDRVDASGCNPPRPLRSRPARTNYAPAEPSPVAEVDQARLGGRVSSPHCSQGRLPSLGTRDAEREGPGSASQECGRFDGPATDGLAAGASSSSLADVLLHAEGGVESSVRIPQRLGRSPSRSRPAGSGGILPQPAPPTETPCVPPLLVLEVDVREFAESSGIVSPLTAMTGPSGTGRERPPATESLARMDSISWTRVRAVRSAGIGIFYDLHVPGAENYAAEGMWHHNSGKTRSAAEWVHEQAMQHPGWRIALVGRTPADVRDVMIEGESGLLAVAGDDQPVYQSTKRRLTWPNGSTAHTYSAEVPAQLRGPQHHAAWCDEPAAWTDAHKGDSLDTAWNNLLLGLRLGTSPQCLFTTTPKPNALVRTVLSRPTTVLTRGTTYDNLANLAPSFRDEVLATYEGTRIGRQELLGELLDDVEGALWTIGLLDENRVQEAPDMRRIVVAVDPSGGSGPNHDEQGIVVAGLGVDGGLYVLADRSCSLSPHGWASRAVGAYHEFAADRIVAERNYGGDMVESTIRQVDAHAAVKVITASRGKAQRAEPVAALYEQHRVHHVGALPKLEDQMTTWTPQDGTSPDRLDSLVWAITELTDDFNAQAWIDYMRRKAETPAEADAPSEPAAEPEPVDEPEDPVEARRRARTAAYREHQRNR